MNIKEKLINEIEKAPEPLLHEVLNFLQFIQKKYEKERLETAVLSESSLQKDWLRPEEDEAWKNL